ncbi:hypothetical protein EVG20_g6969 [Dentipellis fragilis]|uniref:Uncharacterized protein n=1 Tax=Dentipellis fragilis TaxID=205917 RepID=A0A4Y9YIY9_9AGAM|nr:hypothetical protein EVG20_g6969 [Dentipellis fragilis]
MHVDAKQSIDGMKMGMGTLTPVAVSHAHPPSSPARAHSYHPLDHAAAPEGISHRAPGVDTVFAPCSCAHTCPPTIGPKSPQPLLSCAQMHTSMHTTISHGAHPLWLPCCGCSIDNLRGSDGMQTGKSSLAQSLLPLMRTIQHHITFRAQPSQMCTAGRLCLSLLALVTPPALPSHHCARPLHMSCLCGASRPFPWPIVLPVPPLALVVPPAPPLTPIVHT